MDIIEFSALVTIIGVVIGIAKTIFDFAIEIHDRNKNSKKTK